MDRPVIRTLIVDDEPLARQRVRQFLKSRPEFRVAAECASGTEAVRDILRLKPDLLFLDIQMPGLTGFDVIETVGPERMPVIIFVTAYDRYALKAFDVHAVDYLLKPYTGERFEHALQEAVREIQRRRTSGTGANLGELLAALREDGRVEARLLVRSTGRIHIVKVADIHWIGAAGNYVELHVADQIHLLRRTMNEMVRQLDPSRFIRIHRSTIVNVERVRELKQLRTGDFEVTLRDGQKLAMSRRFKDELARRVTPS